MEGWYEIGIIRKEYADGWIKLLKVDEMITFTQSAQHVLYNENGGIVSDIKCL